MLDAVNSLKEKGNESTDKNLDTDIRIAESW